MNIVDVLKIQNRYLEAQEQTESIKTLIMFNDELIEKIEFEKTYPYVFSERVVRLLVSHGFGYSSANMDHPRCYENRSVRFCHGETGTIEVYFKDKKSDGYHWDKLVIQNEDFITDAYLISILAK